MKILLGGLALLVVIVAFCVGNYIYAVRCIESIVAELDLIKSDVGISDWGSAHARLTGVIRNWGKKEPYFMSVLWHQHIDDVTVALNQVKSYIELMEPEESANSIIEARTILRDIIDMESVSIGSIF